MKRANYNPIYYLLDFISDYLINIKDIFLKGNNKIIIVYK